MSPTLNKKYSKMEYYIEEYKNEKLYNLKF